MGIDETALEVARETFSRHLAERGITHIVRATIEAYETAKAPATDQTTKVATADDNAREKAIGKAFDKASHQPDEFTLLGVLADIRQKTGLGDKVMLSDLADTLAALIQNGDSAIDTNEKLAQRLLVCDTVLLTVAMLMGIIHV